MDAKITHKQKKKLKKLRKSIKEYLSFLQEKIDKNLGNDEFIEDLHTNYQHQSCQAWFKRTAEQSKLLMDTVEHGYNLVTMVKHFEPSKTKVVSNNTN